MVPFLTWSDDWLLGIETLDNQHKLLADCLNKLVVECKRETDGSTESLEKRKQVLASLFNDLYITTKKHFSLEEALMRNEEYPLYATHAREHLMLIAELKATFDQGMRNGCCNLNPDILRDLKSWLIAHVSRSDRHFADFLLEKHPAVTASEH